MPATHKHTRRTPQARRTQSRAANRIAMWFWVLLPWVAGLITLGTEAIR